MKDIHSLEQTSLENLPWNKARIKFVTRFLLAFYAIGILAFLGYKRWRWIEPTDKVGAVDLHILIFLIVSRGVGFPVVWIVLPKAGNSDAREREMVIKIFLDLPGSRNVVHLLGDCKSVWHDCFYFLKRHRIKFQMRLHAEDCQTFVLLVNP